MRRGSFLRAVTQGMTLSVGALVLACVSDFDTSREIPKRGSVGRELYSLVCDRVGAQALREDVTGASHHAVCHPDKDGKYADKVDQALLPPIDSLLEDVNGNDVTIDQQKTNRTLRVARIEALARRREELIAAFDAAFPDIEIVLKDLGAVDPEKSCDPITDKRAQKDKLLKQLANTLSRIVDLYNDKTIPHVTRALGRMMLQVQGDKEAQAALARMDARIGYRPSAITIGVARPALSYPRLVDLANSLLRVIASDSNPFDGTSKTPGKGAAQFQTMLRVLHEELRTATKDAPLGALGIGSDPKLPTRELLSRPRSTLEIARSVLVAEDPAYAAAGAPPRFIVRRDPRAFATVPLVAGKVPAPFVDLTGPSGKPDGLPDLDALGEFVIASGAKKPPSPFFAMGAVDGTRDTYGRAALDGKTPLYAYIDTNRTFAASLVRDLRPLVQPGDKGVHSTVMRLASGLPVLFGSRDADPLSEKIFPPDPSLLDGWKAAHPNGEPPPKNLTTSEVRLKYRGFHPETSPIVDLVYALGQILARPEMDDALALFQKLVQERPQEFARLIGLGLDLKAMADRHPEAKIPAQSMLWDEFLDTFVKIAQTPGILEDLLRAFGNDKTLKLDKVFAAYIKYKDELTYDRNNLNGPVFNLTTGGIGGLVTPVDRTQPDSGKNRSSLQRFMAMLHDANGLSACTKDNAIAHVDIRWPAGSGIPVKLDYPTNPLAKAVCAFVGSSAPSKLPLCGVLRLENVAELLLDVALDRAKFDIRDDCLAKLVASPLTGIVGGTDPFLEETSGIKGFSTHPTIAGVARMVFYDTAHDGLPGDTTPATAKTHKFLMGVLDPVPTMVCPEAPFTDTDGKVIKLRKCASFADTMRGRHLNALFPLELMDFVTSVRPLAAAFADHKQPLLFVQLFDTLHRHWGSTKQTKNECDPSLPKTDARWCAQDGAVSYEPLLAEMLESDLFPTIYELIKILETTKIPHCDSSAPTSHQCTKTTEIDGIKVLAEATRVLLDPARSPGLVDRKGNAFAVRNDGTKNPQVTPIYLFIDALKAIDAVFEGDDAKGRLPGWRSARSDLVDRLFSVDGKGKEAKFKNPAIQKVLPTLLGVTRAQIFARCPNPTAECKWARTDLAKNLSEVVAGPSFAATLDILEALRTDDAARTELEQLLVYLLDAASENDAQVTTLSALVDMLQVLDDDTNLTPLYRVIANAATTAVKDDAGNVVQRGLIDGAVEVLARIFAKAYDDKGREICAKEIDPNRTIDVVIKRFMKPMGDAKPSPIEVLMSVIGDVNRRDPRSLAKFDGADYANVAKEVADFCLHESRGLEQVYEVIRQATLPPAKTE